MSGYGFVMALAILLVTATIPLGAQQTEPPSLADLARQAEAVKATTPMAKKTYTNASLSPDSRGEPAPAPEPATGFVSSTLGKLVTAEEIIARSEEKIDLATGKALPEEYWRGRAASMRTQIEPLQKRMTTLTKPHAARDASPGATARNELEVAKVRQGLDGLMKQWAAFEESARVASIPSDWLDPRPDQ